MPTCFVWEFSRCSGITESLLWSFLSHFLHRGGKNFLGLSLFEMFVQSYDLRLLPQAPCMGQQVSTQGVGKKETPLHLRPCCSFRLAYGKSCGCATVPLQPNRTPALQVTPGTTHGPWRGACWHKELQHEQQKF